jgi:hypothetical protein
MIPARDEHALSVFFGPHTGELGAPSAFSKALARAEIHHRDSQQHVIHRPRMVNALRELAPGPDGTPRFARFLTPWAYLDVPGSHVDGAAPEDNTPTIAQDLRVALRLERVRLASEEAYLVLERLYGEEGTRWAQQPREQPLGRLWAIVSSTPEGQKELTREVRRLARKGKAPPEALTACERLAVLAAKTPQPAWVFVALEQAEQMQRQAWTAWEVAQFDKP